LLFNRGLLKVKKDNKKEETDLVSEETEDELGKDSVLDELEDDEESPKKETDDWDTDY
jgi:hypothetical protein